MKKYRRKNNTSVILGMLWGGLEPNASKDEREKDFTQSPGNGKPRKGKKQRTGLNKFLLTSMALS